MNKSQDKTNLQLRERIKELEQIERGLRLDIRGYQVIIQDMEKHIQKLEGGIINDKIQV